MKDRQFVGRASILAARKDKSLPIRVGLELEGRRAAREECEVFSDSQKVGFITSGTYAPTLEKAISMGYVDPGFSELGTELIVDIRGKSHPAKIVEVPFYKRP